MEDRYSQIDIFQEDQFGSFAHATDNESGEPVVLRIFSLPQAIETNSKFAQLRQRMNARCDSLIKLVEVTRLSDTRIRVAYKKYPNTLQDTLQLKTVPSSAVFLKWTFQILRGLLELHCHNVVHGNLKPNIIHLDEHKNVLVGGFGEVPTFPAELSLYQAPEQLRTGQPTMKSDIYCFGLVLYQLLHFKLPSFPLRFATDISEEVTEFISLCLEEAEDKRPTAFELFQTSLGTLYNNALFQNPIEPEEKPKFHVSIVPQGVSEKLIIHTLSVLERDEENLMKDLNLFFDLLGTCYAFDPQNLPAATYTEFRHTISVLTNEGSQAIREDVRRRAAELHNSVSEIATAGRLNPREAENIIKALKKTIRNKNRLPPSIVEKLIHVLLQADRGLYSRVQQVIEAYNISEPLS